MILSHEHNFLFLRVEKTASTSMAFALQKFCGEKDVIARIFEKGTEAQNYYYFNQQRQRREIPRHATLSQAQQIFGTALCDKLTKWAIIRNPFERILSLYAWNMHNAKHDTPSQAHFQEWLLADPLAKKVLQKSNDFYFDAQGNKALNFYLRYEKLQEDCTALAKQLKLPNLWKAFSQAHNKAGVRGAEMTPENYFAGFAKGVAFVEEYTEAILQNFGYARPKV